MENVKFKQKRRELGLANQVKALAAA